MNRFLIAALCAVALTGGAAVNSGFGSISASAQQAAPSADGFEYSLSDDGNVIITKCTSDKAEIVIPAQIDGKNVSAVAKGAFYGLADIKSITFESDTTVPEEGSVGFIAEGAKAEGVVIICGSSSAAKEYANKNGFETKLNDITDISSAVIALDKEEFTYDGNVKKPAVTVTLDGKELAAGQDYDVSYSGNINAGQALVTVSAKGRYTGKLTKSFTIKPAKIASGNVTLSGTGFTYSGKAITPRVTVTVSNRRLVKDTDYTLTFSGNSAVGTAYATVTGKGNYEGVIKKSFSIRLANVTGLKSSAVNNSSVTLSWKKTAGATGYKVYLVNLTSGKYTLKANVKTNSAKVSGLAVGTKYKFAVRA
ncbi:MAG: fibronectin type III domain-containing protein [Ruminococcus sp.]|nr:fibronectin type III domain-containing protein [Ruminococcus sp.]